MSNYSDAIKKNGTSDSIWWLRSSCSSSATSYIIVFNNGYWNTSYMASSNYGVSPAFRIG